MARSGRSGVALAAAVTVGLVLVLFEAIVRGTRVGDTGARTPSSLVSEAVATVTGVEITGWPVLVVPVLIVLLLGLLIDALAGTRR